jgi:hypothetical protein
MGASNEMSLVLERLYVPATGSPDRRTAPEADSRLNVTVVSTSIKATIVALKRAAVLASSLGAHITLLVPQIVPYPLPLSSPPVLLEFNERRFRILAAESGVETKVCIYLCRDRWEMLAAVLKARSVLVLGGRKAWWPTAEKTLARRLRRAGHEVVFVETE